MHAHIVTVHSLTECMHKELACTANISIVHERILLKFEILFSDNETKTIRSVLEIYGTCVHAQRISVHAKRASMYS